MRILHWALKLLVWAVEVVVVLFVLGWGFMRAVAYYQTPPPGPMGEVQDPGEQVLISQIIANGENLIQSARKVSGDGVYRRDAHAKTHGCMLAKFTVPDVTDARTRTGLFAKTAEYKAWIRFSSGNEKIQNDWLPDARGMAIKVLGVAGTKLLEGEEGSRSCDFLLINNRVFFIRNVQDYALTTKYQGDGNQFGYYFEGYNPFRWRMRDFHLGLGLLKPPPPENLLATQFHSLSAYRLGTGNYVKYTAKPVACAGGSMPGWWAGFGRDALRNSLREQIRNGQKYCFDFQVQFQVRGKNMPVEDSTVEWKEKDSPFITVARIEIDGRDHEIDEGLTSNFCENLSYSPWRTLAEHEPVGGLNRVRQAVYHSISRLRRCKNGIAYGEPLEDGSMKFSLPPCQAGGEAPLIPPPRETSSVRTTQSANF